MVDIDSAAELPTETNGKDTHEYMLDNTHQFQSVVQLVPDLRLFPMSEDLILNYNVLNIWTHVKRHFPMYAQKIIWRISTKTYCDVPGEKQSHIRVLTPSQLIHQGYRHFPENAPKNPPKIIRNHVPCNSWYLANISIFQKIFAPYLNYAEMLLKFA